MLNPKNFSEKMINSIHTLANEELKNQLREKIFAKDNTIDLSKVNIEVNLSSKELSINSNDAETSKKLEKALAELKADNKK